MNKEDIVKMIKKHEGFRNKVYVDSVGIPTGGYGHAFLPDSPLPKEVCNLLFEQDFKTACRDFFVLSQKENLELNSVRRAVMIDMLFNMGLTRVSGFKRMLAAMYNQDWETAAEEMLDSRWARQVGGRAAYLSQLMERGKR